MASVFRRSGRNTYDANVKLWDATAGKWKWKQEATHVTDEGRALAIATALENASGEAKAGKMTRARARALVDSMLQLAGVHFVSELATMATFGKTFIHARIDNVEGSTGRKYQAHWDRWEGWCGQKMSWPFDRWTGDHFTEYYKNLRAELGATTANNHMTTLSMIFLQAAAAGHLEGNPVELVELDSKDSEDKIPLTRADTVKLFRYLRREKNEVGLALSLLGRHTGHRIQDLLSRTEDHVHKVRGVGWTLSLLPRKKRGKGNSDREARDVVLPIPAYVAAKVKRLKDFKSLHNADNRRGQVSADFNKWLIAAGVDTQPVKKTKRTIHLKTFHSFRHSMSSRLAAAEVPGELARLVTDHESPKVQRGYVHAEIVALAGALKKARRW